MKLKVMSMKYAELELILKDSSVGAIWVDKTPTAHEDVLEVASKDRRDGKLGEAGSCHEHNYKCTKSYKLYTLVVFFLLPLYHFSLSARQLSYNALHSNCQLHRDLFQDRKKLPWLHLFLLHENKDLNNCPTSIRLYSP